MSVVRYFIDPLLIPLLNVLFNQASTNQAALYRILPAFSLSPSYFSFLFNHFFSLFFFSGKILNSMEFLKIFFFFFDKISETGDVNLEEFGLRFIKFQKKIVQKKSSK